MTMFNYESDELAKICQGNHSSDTLYVADCKKTIIDGVRGSYPQLSGYEKEWLDYGRTHYEGGTPSNLEYQSITVNPYGIVLNAIPFRYKSAILKGQTLVNYATGMTFVYNNNGGYCSGDLKNPETTSNKTITIINNNSYNVTGVVNNLNGAWVRNINILANSHTTLTLTSSEKLWRIRTLNNSGISLDDYVNSRFIIYDGDFKNVPYFEGMQSVKMPVLTTTGKNLYSYGDLVINNPKTNTWYYTNGKTSKFGSSCNRTDGGNWFYLENGVYSYNSINENAQTIIVLVGEGETVYNSGKEVPSGWYVLRFKTKPESVDYAKISQIQLEKGPNITTYEPYKSNILTVNEPVELRKVGDVQDELDLLTGELTQRIDEVVLDGSQSRDHNYNGVFDSVYRIGILHSEGEETVLGTQTIGCCDKLVSVFDWNGDYEHFYVGKSAIILFINKGKIGELNDENINKYLQQNPISVQYQLATPVVKTVALSHQIKPYEDTNHYEVSSDTIPPIGELSVPVVSTGAQTLNDILTSE